MQIPSAVGVKTSSEPGTSEDHCHMAARDVDVYILPSASVLAFEISWESVSNMKIFLLLKIVQLCV